MWWFMAVAFAGPFDGRWQVAQQVAVNTTCSQAPHVDATVVITGSSLRTGSSDLAGSIDGEALFASGVAGRAPETQRWELHRSGEDLVGTVRIEASCVSTLSVVLTPARDAAPVASPLPPPPPPAAPPAMTSELWWTVEPAISFVSGKAELAAESTPGLVAAAERLQARPDGVIEIAVHSDSMGSDVFNQKLSQQRAEAVRAWLVANGIPASRLVAGGYGELYPIAENGTVQGRATNRRVELRLSR